MPTRAPAPPENPANTGTPTAPKARYTPTAALPTAGPSTQPHRATAKVCKVTGIPVGRGMDTWDSTTSKAANTPASTVRWSLFFH